MFCLSILEHTLRLPPHLLKLPLNEAIKGELERLFLDKVVGELGLCVSIYDVQSIDGGFIFAGDGASTYTVKFRLMMFRPFVGEVIAARLKESTIDRLCLSLGFFDDIYVPQPLLPTPCSYEPDPVRKDQVRWIWTYGGTQFPIDGVDEIRFQVMTVSYPSIPLEQKQDSKPSSIPLEQEQDSKPSSIPREQEQDSKPFAPMVVTGILNGDGLGPVSWWE